MVKIPLKVDHYRPASETPFTCRWRADDGPTLNAGLVLHGIRTSIAKKPYIFFLFFQGGGGPDSLPLCNHACFKCILLINQIFAQDSSLSALVWVRTVCI